MSEKRESKGLLYDVERDGHLDNGDVLYIYENGNRELVKTKIEKAKVERK